MFGSVAFNEEESVEAKSFQLKLAAIMSSAFQAEMQKSKLCRQKCLVEKDFIYSYANTICWEYFIIS